MEEMVGARVVGVVPGGHEDHREALGVGAGHAVERGEGPHVERGDHGPDPLDPRITLGGVSGVELVAAADLLHVLVPQQLIEQDEVVVARHHEIVLQADVLEARREVVSDGVV
jgi:hypothetical protein